MVEFPFRYIVLPAPVVLPLPSKFPLIVKEPVPVQEIFPYIVNLSQVWLALSRVIIEPVLIHTLFIKLVGGFTAVNAPTHVPFAWHIIQLDPMLQA